MFTMHLDKILETVTAADERRHNIEHLSVRDLIEQTIKECPPPPGTPVPSENTVLFAFLPYPTVSWK